MKVSEVLIHNYKSICSTKKECRLYLDDKVTFLVGCNENGKTNLLEAMDKFERGDFHEDDIPFACPISQGKDRDDLKMVSVTFSVQEDDKKTLIGLHPNLARADQFTITRNFSGEPYISSPDIKPKSELSDELSRLAEQTIEYSKELKTYVRRYKRTNKEKASATRGVLLRVNYLTKQITRLRESFNRKEVTKARIKTKRLRKTLVALANPLGDFDAKVLEPLDRIFEMLSEIRAYFDLLKVSKKIWQEVPPFIFVAADSKQWLTGEYLVDDVINSPEDDEGYISIRRLLSLANIDLIKVRSMPSIAQTLELERAEQRVTNTIRQIWRQGKEDIQFRLKWCPKEGNKRLLVMVESAGHCGYPQHRSLGFRWFIEFYLTYAVTLLQNTVLLFEEPGIHLHPDAQDDLKALFREEVSKESQVVYTTHLPNMYDRAYPEGCRVVVKEDGITVIQNQFSSEQRATWSAAMKALGIGHPVLRMCSKNIIVEGPSDWIYLTMFARILSTENESLNRVVSGAIHIFPCYKASNIPAIIPFFFQPGVRANILLDSDQAGRAAQGKLKQQYQIPTENVKSIIMINDISALESDLGKADHELEDLLGIEHYTFVVIDWLKNCKSIDSAKLDKKDVPLASCIASQIKKRVKEKYDLEIDKYDIAWRFLDLFNSNKITPTEKTKQYFKDLLLKLVTGL